MNRSALHAPIEQWPENIRELAALKNGRLILENNLWRLPDKERSVYIIIGGGGNADRVNPRKNTETRSSI